jgi:hypothetical protein
MAMLLAPLAARITFITPDGWRQSPPSSSMRVAEFTLPRAAGDAEDAQLIVHQPHFRLRAGVVETSNGPYFIKLTGPEKTVAKWERAFDQFVGSFELQ